MAVVAARPSMLSKKFKEFTISKIQTTVETRFNELFKFTFISPSTFKYIFRTNIGVPIAHTVIGLNSTIKGLDKIFVNKEKIDKDLENNWIVISEGVQTILRREGYSKPYEALKDLTRNNKKIDKSTFTKFIDSLNVSQEIKNELKEITPYNYTGI